LGLPSQPVTFGIRTQLGLTTTLAVALVFFSLALVAIDRDRRDVESDARDRADVTLTAVGVPAAIALANADLLTLDTMVEEFTCEGRKFDLVEMGVVDPEGRIVAHSDPQKFGERPRDKFIEQAMTSSGLVSEVDGVRLRVAVPALSGLRWGTVFATYSLARSNATILRRRNLLLGGCGISAFALLVVLVAGLQAAVVRPVKRLQAMAQALRGGDLDQRAPHQGAAELRGLEDALNEMAASLKTHRDHLSDLVAERTRALSEANARLERLAVTDGLTGLFNHRFFQDTLSSEIKRASRTRQPVSVLMLDVDYFKRFNDAHGHLAGDDLLRSLARVIKEQLRSTDSVARYGGEEFAAILPDTSKSAAVEVAEKVRAAVSRAFEADGKRITISLGVASCPDDGDAPQAVLRAADEALYEAKDRGRNRVVGARKHLDRVMPGVGKP
jgi:diguanylate cyclase (GGDEF)-like protein